MRDAVLALVVGISASAAHAAAKEPLPPKVPSTPVRLALQCRALGGPVWLDVDVKGEQAVLRVEYPQAPESYGGSGEDSPADTSIYFDSDNDARSGLEEWDEDSAKLKGVDYSVEARADVSKVFKHDGSISMASGSYTVERSGNTAVFTVDLAELHAEPGFVVRALFTVGECGPVSETFRLGTAPRTRTAKAPAAKAAPKAVPAADVPGTPAHLDLDCPPLGGAVGLDIDVKEEAAILRVTYPAPFESFRGQGDKLIDTFIYFDSDNDARSGLEEWDDESLKLKGADYSVDVREYPDQGSDAVNGTVLHAKVFKHEGTMANATGSFQSEYAGNAATFTVDLAELHAARGSVVKAMFEVGACGPVSQTLRLGPAPPVKKAAAKKAPAAPKPAAGPAN
jgi:hypothetical protein